jgi:ribosome biogenesis GTPase
VLETIGYDPSMARWAEATDTSLGRVARVDRGIAAVLTEAGPVRAGLGAEALRRLAEDPVAAPCTGDWCVLRDWVDRRTTLELLLPRRTAVVRSTAGGQSHGQVLCANADLVAVVVALEPEPVLSRIERLLSLAWASGAQPLVVLTKADLVRDAPLIADDVRAVAPDVEVLTVSVATGAGVDRLRGLVAGRLTLALIGSSGHGKSSLTNALVGAEVLRTRGIRADGRGRHTTVRRELVPLPGGGALIDTPGLRGIGLAGEQDGLRKAFADIDLLAAGCRFDDCAHTGEPGCAVVAAVEDGRLNARRLDRWQRLQRELVWRSRRASARTPRRR